MVLVVGIVHEENDLVLLRGSDHVKRTSQSHGSCIVPADLPK